MYANDGEFVQVHFRWHGNLTDKTVVFGFHSFIVSTTNLLEWLGKEESMVNKEQSCYLGVLFSCKETHPKQYTMKLHFYSSLILVIASSIPKGEITLVNNSTLKGNDTIFLLFLEFLVTKNITPLSFGSYSKIMCWPLSQNTQERVITLHQITSILLVCLFLPQATFFLLAGKDYIGCKTMTSKAKKVEV